MFREFFQQPVFPPLFKWTARANSPLVAEGSERERESLLSPLHVGSWLWLRLSLRLLLSLCAGSWSDCLLRSQIFFFFFRLLACIDFSMCRSWINILYLSHYNPSMYPPSAFYPTSPAVSCGCPYAVKRPSLVAACWVLLLIIKCKKMLIRVCKKKKENWDRLYISTGSPARCGAAAATLGLHWNTGVERSELVLEPLSAKVPCDYLPPASRGWILFRLWVSRSFKSLYQSHYLTLSKF